MYVYIYIHTHTSHFLHRVKTSEDMEHAFAQSTVEDGLLQMCLPRTKSGAVTETTDTEPHASTHKRGPQFTTLYIYIYMYNMCVYIYIFIHMYIYIYI